MFGNPLMIASGGILHHILDSDEVFGFTPGYGITKHIVFLWMSAVLVIAFFSYVARDKGLVPGKLKNFSEVLLCYLRDEVVYPNMGHEGKKFLPYVWTVFFFILFNNLIGLIPGGATATGNLSVTGALAITTLIMIHATAIKKHKSHYLGAIVPAVPLAIWPMMFILEIIGFLAKTFALAVRLFANMVAGHLVLFAIIGFVLAFPDNAFVAVASIGGAVAIYCLEIFVAFLQAFIFTFLTVIFIGEVMHGH